MLLLPTSTDDDSVNQMCVAINKVDCKCVVWMAETTDNFFNRFVFNYGNTVYIFV